jgi:predicted nucleic acid-binding protein
VIALDTSVVVAAFAPWHEHHEVSVDALAERPRLPASVATEAYAVLTRLPQPFRADAALVVEFFGRTFAKPRLGLSAEVQQAAPERLHAAGISGGASYDGLIALAVLDAGASLISLDHRASRTYELCGVETKLLA